MIARVWHGYAATREQADAYEALLKPELLPGVSRKKGYRGSHLLRRDLGNEIEFVTILLFDSLEDVKALTGADFETAVVPMERRRFLSRYDLTARHYEVTASHGLTMFTG